MILIILLIGSAPAGWRSKTTIQRLKHPESKQVDLLVTYSEHGFYLHDPIELNLSQADMPAAYWQILNHPDASSIHVLAWLRRQRPQDYAHVPQRIKARILLAYLKRSRFITDWSLMHEEDRVVPVVHKKTTKSSERAADKKEADVRAHYRCSGYDFEAAEALLEIPPYFTLPSLIEMLRDRSSISREGSDATWAERDHLRLCDLACRYVCILMNRDYKWTRDVYSRDGAIQSLLDELDRARR
jgi:hypothetical protein